MRSGILNFSVHSPGNLVAETLAGNDSDLLTYPLVGVEIKCKAGVVLLDDHPRRLFHRLSPDTTLKLRRKTQMSLERLIKRFFSPKVEKTKTVGYLYSNVTMSL